MKKLMLLAVVIAFALPACGKKNQPAPAKPETEMKTPPPGGEGEAKPEGSADPCAGKTADPCAGK